MEREICYATGDDSTEYNNVGAADIGELTYAQFRLCKDEFYNLYNGWYLAHFVPQVWLPNNMAMSLKVLIGNYNILSTEQRKILDIAVHTANNVRNAYGCGHKNIVSETSAQPPNIMDYPRMPQVPTGVGVPDTIKSYQASIEDSDGTVPNVNVVNQLTKDVIADAVFDGTYRANARFKEPIDEAPIEKVHRLRCDGVEWKYIGRTIYREENKKDIDEKDLPSYVDTLRQQHKREYPEYYQVKK